MQFATCPTILVPEHACAASHAGPHLASVCTRTGRPGGSFLGSCQVWGAYRCRLNGNGAGSDEHAKLLTPAEAGKGSGGAKAGLKQQGSFMKLEERATGQVEKRLYWVRPASL